MAESEPTPVAMPDEPEETPGYKPPAEKSIQDMLKQDTEDESLQKYKASLLGSVEETTFCESPTHRTNSSHQHTALTHPTNSPH